MSHIVDDYETVITPTGNVGLLYEYDNKTDRVVTFREIYEVDRTKCVNINEELPNGATEKQKKKYREINGG